MSKYDTDEDQALLARSKMRRKGSRLQVVGRAVAVVLKAVR